VIAGGYRRARAHSRLRAAVNARLEEISFRTGLITATIGLVALSAIAAAGVYAATLSLGSQAVAAAGALSAAGAPIAAPATTASAQPTTQGHPSATSPPKAKRPVTAATTSPLPAAGSRAWAQADSSQAGSRYDERAGFSGHRSWYGGYSPWRGGPGFPGHGFGAPGPRDWGRP
jgi:hypothetical protein